MNINAINHAVSTPIKKIENAIGKDDIQPAQVEPLANPSIESTTNEESETKAKGVLRLLQEGHFKGVADIRLRINFHEQISALEQKAQEQVIESGVRNLLQTLNGEIGSFLESDDLSPDMISNIEQLSSQLNSGIEANRSMTTDQLISGLQTSFDEFSSGVEALIPAPGVPNEEPPVIEAPADETIAIDKTAVMSAGLSDMEPVANDDISPLQQFLTDITALFASQLSELEKSMADISLLPDLSQPKGNGTAYDKFLSEYNKLTGAENQAVDLPATDSLA